MKKYLGVFIIAAAVVLLSVAVYSANAPKGIVVEGYVPKEWGSLKYVEPFKPGDRYHKRLYFEDTNGNIRMVGIFLFKDGFKVGERVIVIKRSQ
jgi:hypothetical protein